MAEEENTELDLDKVGKTGAEEEASPEEEGDSTVEDSPQKPKKKLIIIGGVVLFLLIILSVTGFLYLHARKAAELKAKQEEKIETAPLPEIRTVPLNNLDIFLIPIRDDNGEERFIKIGMSMELSEGTLVKEIEKNLSLIRSNIFDLVSREKVSIFRTAKGRKQVRENIRNVINVALQTGTIKKIYFTELVIL